MKIKEVERIIREYKKKKARIDILREELESLEATGVSALNFDYRPEKYEIKMVKPTEDEALELNEIKDRVNKRILVLEKQIKIVEKSIDALSDIEKEVIYNKLILAKPYWMVCADIHISERTAKRIKKSALEKLAGLLDNYEGRIRCC